MFLVLLTCFLFTPLTSPENIDQIIENRNDSVSTQEREDSYDIVAGEPTLEPTNEEGILMPLSIEDKKIAWIDEGMGKNQEVTLLANTQIGSLLGETAKPIEENPDYPTQIPEKKDETLLTLSGEFLYWQAIQDNLLTSIKANGINSGNLSSLVWVNQRFHFDPGFKAKLAVLLPYDEWRLSAAYTFLQSSHSQHSKNSHPEFYMVLSGHTQTLAEEVKSGWELHFQALDLSLSKNLLLSDHFEIHPQMGIKGVFPNQQWHVTYIRPLIEHNELIFLNQRIYNFFWSLGPNLGMNLSWKLPKNLALQIKPSWSLMYARIYSTVTYSNILATTNPNAIIKGKENTSALIPQMEMWLGAEWSYPFNQNRLFQLTVGYDVQYFWNEANILAFVQMPQGNLMLNGATLGLHFTF